MRKQLLSFFLFCLISVAAYSQYNTSYGDYAGYFGRLNTSIGYNAGHQDNSRHNVFLGAYSGFSTISGGENTFLGCRAGLKNISGKQNTFVGTLAGASAINKSENVFIGFLSGYNSTGNQNILIGNHAGENNTSNLNVFVGFNSGMNNQAFGNMFIGSRSGETHTTGTANTFLGNFAGQNSTVCEGNTFVGFHAGDEADGSKNIYVGYNAGHKANANNEYNVFMGFGTGGLSQGNRNVFLGSLSGAVNQHSDNVFIGYLSATDNQTGYQNVIIGSEAAQYSQMEAQNVMLGYESGMHSGGGRNVFIGPFSGFNVTESDKLYIQNNDHETPLIYGDFLQKQVAIQYTNPGPYTFFVNGEASAVTWYETSDKRFKENINTIQNPLEKIEKLSGHTYNFVKDNPLNRNLPQGLNYGFIAQELQETLPELVKTDSDGYLAVNYNGVIPILVEAIKEMESKYTQEINALKTEIALLQNPQDPVNIVKSASQAESMSFTSTSILYQNVPNPFNADSRIQYFLSDELTSAAIYVYDLQGKQLLVYADLSKGSGEVVIEAGQLSPGIYNYALIADGQVIDVKKVVVTQ